MILRRTWTDSLDATKYGFTRSISINLPEAFNEAVGFYPIEGLAPEEMLLRTLSLILGLLISSILLFVTYFVSHRSYKDREKQSPFECGFDPKSSARLPFSLRFFLLGVIFLVFDIEIALLLPIPLAITTITSILVLSLFLFLFILIIGVIHEWNQGSLTWVYNT